ncbi:MAG: hypothetical protein EOP54_04535 [Sphingobacteriales bacterium]|nr:MAG: hypothetical protein EOP54_04535 [Sphingobacteriales bacterium]
MKRLQRILLSLHPIKQYCSILVLLLLVSLKATGQGAVLNHTYSFSEQSYTIYELTTVMQQQADISISYDARQIKSKTKIRLPKASMTAKELAVLLNKNYHIKAKFIGKHIILQKEVKALARHTPKKKKAKARILAAQEPVRSKTGSMEPLAPVKVVPQLSLAILDTIAEFADTFTVDSKTISEYEWTIAPVNEAALPIGVPTDRLDNPEVTSLGEHWYQKFGLSFNVAGDEVFYLNPGLSLHWSNLSVSGNYAIRGDLSHFRFGLSYTKPVNNNLRATIWANYGAIPDQAKRLNYQYDSITGTPPDSLEVITVTGSAAYKLNGTVWKAGINLDWKLGDRLELFSGLNFSRSRTQILYDDVIQAPRTFIPPAVPAVLRDFSLFPGVLTLSEDFSANRGIYSRSWIGFQVGLRLYLFRSQD